MTREIKFRAWDTKGKAGMVTFSGDQYQLYVMENGNVVGREESFSASEDRFILMQYTGLKDKKGKEIFESDLVKVDDKIVLVWWYREKAKFTAATVTLVDDGEDVKVTDNFGLLDLRLGEVVGNMYQDLELIEGRK